MAACGMMVLHGSDALALGIVPDGRTATQVATSGPVANITTATISGSNAFNSFAQFSIGSGETANLIVPGSALNLINIVHDQTSLIDGTLNAYRNGSIGGNVYFANPHGLIVSASGTVNVGSFNVSTPTQAYVDSFFSSTGTPSAVAVAQLMDGSVPISPSGLISIRGHVNAIDGVTLRAGGVEIAGGVQTGARYAMASPTLSDVINLNGIASGTRIVERNGHILIEAQSDVTVSGSIAADGGDNVRGGDLNITAGGNVLLDTGTSLSARGSGLNSDGGNIVVASAQTTSLQPGATLDVSAGSSGDGGHIELSGKGAVDINGGNFMAGATAGKAGSVLIDPVTIQWTGAGQDVFHNDGASYTLQADQQIVLDDVVISTRNVGSGHDRNNIDAAHSVNDSGSITLLAPDIQLSNGTRLLANADNGHVAGDVTLTATQAAGGTASISLSNTEIQGKTVSLQASSALTDSSLGVSTGLNQALATASIDINSSQLSAVGGDLLVSSAATVNAATNTTLPIPESILRIASSATVNVHGDVLDGSGTTINSSLTGDGVVHLSSDSQVTANATPNSPLANLNGDAAVAVSNVNSTSSVHIGDASRVNATGALNLDASNTVTATSIADASAAGSSAAGAAVAYNKIVDLTQTAIDGQADISHAGTLGLSATSDVTSVVTAKAAAQGAQQDSSGSGMGASLLSLYGDEAKTSDGGVKVAGALGIDDLSDTTQSYLASSNTAIVTGGATVSSKANNSAVVTADASATDSSVGVGVAVGINRAKSVNQAYVAQNIQAASLTIEAGMTNASAPNLFSTIATSGAGASNVGVAGALTVNLIDTSALASLNANDVAALTGGDASLTSDDQTDVTGKAVANATAGKVGVGASVAIDVVANRSTAELQDGADITGATNIGLMATGAFSVDTETDAGSAGGIAVTPSAAIAVVNDTTSAVLGTGNTLSLDGAFNADAEQSAITRTIAKGDAGGDNVAIGAALAVNVVNDDVLATTDRAITAGTGALDGVSFTALGDSASSAQAKASAAGGKTDDQAGTTDSSGKKVEDASVDNKVASQIGTAQDKQTSAGIGDSDQQAATGSETGSNQPSASTSDGKLSVAAAIGVNIANSTAKATTGNGRDITAGGTLALKSQNNTDGQATADGSAVGTAAVGIGAGVSINKVKSVNDAVVGKATYSVGGLSAEATMKNVGGDTTNTMDAESTSGAGAGKVGVAGSLALNLVDTESQALITGGGTGSITGGAVVNANGGDVALTSEDATDVTGKAAANATAGKVGVGASVAVDVVANRSQAELQDGADLNGAGSLGLTANGTFSVDTETDAGSAGGVAITPSVAVALVNDKTQALIGSGSDLVVTGDVSADARQSARTTTSAKGSAAGSNAAIGAAVAVNVVNDDVLATTARNIDTTGATGTTTGTKGDIRFSAFGDSASSAQSTASAAGGKTDDQAGTTDASGKKVEDASVDDKVSSQIGQAKTDQQANGVGDASQQSETDSADAGKPSASSSEGKISVAAAVSVNLQHSNAKATLPDAANIGDMTVKAKGKVTLSTSNNTDGAALSDGSTVGSTAALGIGAGISVNLVKSVNEASVGQNVQVTSNGLTLEAQMTDVNGDGSDLTNNIDAEAKSGAGSSKVGLAGSLALNIADTSSQALVKTGAEVDAGNGAVQLTADDRTDTTGKALPADGGGATGGKVGIGASVAVNVIANRSIAEVQDNAKLSTSGNVDLAASGDYAVDTEVEAGAEGGVAITPAVALAIIDNTTSARLGTGQTLTNPGSVTISADHASSTTTSAKGSAQGDKAAIGAAVGIVLLNDVANASLERDIETATGAVSISAHASSASTNTATASAVGGKSTDDAGATDPATGKPSEDATVDDKVNNQTAFGKKAQTDNGVGDSSQQNSTATADSNKTSASSDEGQVAVAAAVAVNIVSAQANARIASGVTVKTAGSLALSASGNTDSSASSDGSSVGSTAKVGIGAGVSVNKVDSHNEASIGQNAQVTAHDVSVEAVMTNLGGDTTNTIAAEAKSGAGGSKVGIAASLALNVADTSSKALIDSGASVDTGGSLTMTSDDASSYTAKATPTTDGGATGGKVGVGASVALNLITSHSLAQIGTNAGVSNAGDITLTATTEGDSDAEGTAGATGGKLAFDAAVAVTTLDQTTDASIASGSDIAATGNVGLTAGSSGSHTATTTGVAKSGSVSIGASVGVITSTSTTNASIDRNVGADGSFGLAASSNRSYDAEATASAGGSQSEDTYTNNQTQADKSASSTALKDNQNSETNQGTQGGGKVNVAAAVGVTAITDNVTATVTGGRTIHAGAGQAMDIDATNNSNFKARGAGDAVDPNSKVGVGIGVGIAIANNHTTAALDTGTHITRAGDLTLQAISTQNLDAAFSDTLSAEGIAGAGGSKVGVAGAFAVVDSNLDTSATIGDDTLIDQAGAVKIDAENTSTLSAKAWAGAFGNVGVGASVATVISNNQYTAKLGGGTTNVTADSLEITARNNKFTPTPFALSLGNIGDLSDEASIKAKFTDITNQLTNGRLLGGGNYYTEAAAGAAGDRVSVAGSFAVNVFKDVTDASIGAGATVNAGSGAVNLTASNDTVARSVAGSASAGGSVGVGVSSADVASTDVTRSHIDDGVTISQSGSIGLDATNKQDIEVIGIAAAASNSVAVGGVANVITLDNSADAYVADSTTTLLTSAGNFTLGATNTVTGMDIASGLSASGSVGVGIAAAVNTVGTDSSHQFGTHAYIGDGATVNAGQTTDISAAAGEDLTNFAIAGAASGSVSVGGAAVTNVMNTDTRAYVGSDAKVNKGQTHVAQSASLAAGDTTSLFDVIVGVGAGGNVGVGASGDVGVINKSTQAYLGNGAWLETAGNLSVQSTASEDFRSIAIGLGIGGSAGGAGSVSVYSLTTDTLAYLDNSSTLRVDGNALISADDATDMNLIAGSAAGGGDGAIGAAAGVTVFDKTTQATIGDNVDAEVLGFGSTIDAATGDMAISFGGAIGGNGQVKNSSISPKDAQGNSVAGGTSNAIGDHNAFQGLTHTRTATPVTSSMRGLAVTATNRDKLESFSVTGAAGGGLAITLGGNVGVLTTDTEASIGSSAKINQNGTTANPAQSVRVAAGNDQFHIGLAGAASGAGGVAAGAGADVIVANNTVAATIGKDAKVKAAQNVEVLAHGQEQYLEMGAGLAAAGSLAVAGSVGVVSINDATHASIVGGTGATTQVDAGGNVRVTSGDDTETDMISGAAAAGFGTAGLGVAVGVNIIDKDTQASIGDGVTVNALGGSGAAAFTGYLPDSTSDTSTAAMHGLQVQATSKEDLFGVSASGAAGLYAGVSGAVTVTTVASNTAASIGNNARINLANSGAATDQDVNVSARNQLSTLDFTGSVAVAGGVGISGGFDVFTAKNNTTAGIGSGAEVHAARDVVVNALASEDLHSTVVSAAGGLVAGVAGGISVYSVGDKLGADAQGQLSSSGDVKGEADSQATDGSINNSLLGSSTDSNVQSVSAKAQVKRASVSTDAATGGTPAAGNSATIGNDAKVFSGRDTAVNARGTLNYDSTTGAAAVGAVGLGVGIGIANFSFNDQASIGTGAQITAGGDLLVHASLDESAQGLAFAGSGGIVAVNADWSDLNDNSTLIASIGSGTSVHQAGTVQVEAQDVRNVDAQAIGASVGAYAGGASVATSSIGGTTSAYIGTGSFIGAGTDVVGNLDVSADSHVKATSSTLAAAAGIGLAATGSAATATATPTVTAYVDDGSNIDLTGSASVQAVGAAGASADALGFSVAGGIGIGASIALAKSSPQISAYLGQNTALSAASLNVSATHELPNFLYAFDNSLDSHLLARSQVSGLSVLASASGTSGGALLGAVGTDAEADYGTTDRQASVTANVGDGSSLSVPGTLNVSATNDSGQNASSSGLAFGIAAIGSNDAYARSNSVTHAKLGKTVHIDGGTTGATSITAQGTDSNIAQSVSGSGGVIAGAAATANTVEISDTQAMIGDSTCGAPSASCGIVTGSLNLSGNHDSIYNGKVDSTQASVAGASGASNSHNISSQVNVGTGTGVNVTAGNIAITATNASHKYWWGQSSDINSTDVADAAAWNVDSGSGGLLNLPAGRTVTTLDQRTNVSIGDDSIFHVLLPSSGIGSFTLDANNIIVSYDKTKLDSGGAIALAESNSMITAGSSGNPDDPTKPKVNAIVNIGANAHVSSDSGNIDIGSHTDAKLDARAVANAYGLAGAPSGKAYINYFGTNTTNLGSGALLLATDPARGAINVAAGENSAQQASSILAHTAVNLWNKTAVPINSTPDAQTNVAQNSTVNLANGSNLLAGGDIGIAADRGNIQVSAVGVGKDLYREVAGAIAHAIGIDVSLDITGGSAPEPGGLAQANVDGTVLSGLLRQSATQIDPVILTTNPDGSVIWQIKYSPVDSTTNPGLAANPLDASQPNPYIGYLTGSAQAGQLALGNIQESDVPPNSQLQARITLLQGLLAKYAADPVSSAAYQSEIDFLTKKLGTQGIGQNSIQVTARGGAALDAAGAVDSALANYQTLITGDITGNTIAKQEGAVGGLIADYGLIDANNTTINSNLVGMKNAPATPSLAADTTYAALTTNRTQAASDYTNLSTAVTHIGNYSFVCDMTQPACAAGAPVDAFGHALPSDTTTTPGFRIVTGTGYLGDVQSSMQNVSQLALQQGGSGTLNSNISGLSGEMANIKTANATILASASDIYTNLSQASTRQATLSAAWRDTASSGNVDTTRVTNVANGIAINTPLIGQFNAATAGSYANIISTNKAQIDTAAANIATAVGTVAAADDTPAPAGTQKLITFPDISVKLGNVNVKADVLAGSGSLQAPGDAKIWILNNAPTSMDIANLTVDATGGNVRLDGFLVNNAADVQRFNPAYTGPVPSIVSRENGLAGQPEIKIVSTYDPSAYSAGSPDPAKNIPAAAPDITLAYRVNTTDPDKVISNPNGLVSVTSAAGDIYVDGNITAGSVSILAKNGDFVQQYVNGFNSVAGEPKNNIQGGSGVLPPNNGAAPGNGIVANGNIFISARYLNINGLVQSGIVNYHLDIPSDALLQFRKSDGTIINKAQADALGQQVEVVVGTNGTNDQSAIGATYDPATQTIFMTSTAKVHGGNITLFGQILNTANGTTGGTGKLAVLDGFGQISVNNASSLPVILKTIDTGADPDPNNPGRGVVGIIDITDVQSVNVNALGQAVMNAIHTIISRDGNQITVKQTGYWNADGTFNPGDPNNPVTTFASDSSLGANPSLAAIQNSATIQNAASRVTSESARLGTYDPQAGLRYVYTTGTDTSTSYTWTFKGTSFFGTSSLSLPPDNVSRTLTSGPNVLSNYDLPAGTYLSYITPVGTATAHQNNLVLDTAMTNAGANSTNAYQAKSVSYQTSSQYTKVREWNDCNWWTLCIASRYTSIWDQITGTTTVTTNSVKADYPIQIEFMGVNTPSLTVNSSNAGVSLAAGSQLNNRYGDTTIDTQSFSAGDASLINTRNLSITTGNGSIGADGAPVNVLMSGTLNANANLGNVEINQIAGALKVATVSASGDPTVGAGKVVLTSQGDLYGDAGNLISGARVELTSANGAIGGIAGNAGANLPLNIATGYTADRGTQQYYGLLASAAGDIGIDAQSSADNPAGHLLVDTVVSLGGDVHLTAPGQILDNNPNFTIDTRTWNQLLNYWDSVALRAGADNTQKVAQAISAYQNGHTQDYAQYWQIRSQQNAPAVYDAGWHYTASAAERTALKNDATAISNFENGRTAQYWALSTEIAGYDGHALARGQDAANLKQANPGWSSAQIETQVLADEAAGSLPTVNAGAQIANFIYVASATERSDQATGSTWTTSQLALGLNPGLLKDVTDTNPVIKAPNVSGRNVSLVAGTSIGSTLPASDPAAVVIPLNTDGNLTDREKVALATAEFSDFVFSDPTHQTGTLTISQRLPVNFTATTGLSASVRTGGNSANPLTVHQANTDLGNIYLASLGSGLINDISADGEVRIKVKGPIVSTAGLNTPAIQSGDLILESANSGIGYIPGDASVSPAVLPIIQPLAISLKPGATLTARAGEDIYLTTSDDFNVGGIFSRKDVHLDAGGSITNGYPGNDLRLLGDNVYLTALGSLGDLASPFNVGTSLDSGRIYAMAGVDAYLNGPTNGLVRAYFTVGSVSAGNAVRLSSDGDARIDGPVSTVGNIGLVTGGTLTTTANAHIDSVTGGVTMNVGDLDMQDGSEVTGGLGEVAITSGGDAIITGISTDNAGAGAVHVSSGRRILDGGDTRFDITALQPGAAVTLDAAHGVGNASRTGTGVITDTPNPLEIAAWTFNANVASGGLWGHINLDNGNIALGDHGPLVLTNSVLGSRLTLTNPTTRVVLDTVNKRPESNVNIKLYVPDHGFNVNLDGRVLTTTNYVLQRQNGYETHSPAGSNVSVESAILDEFARHLAIPVPSIDEWPARHYDDLIHSTGPVMIISQEDTDPLAAVASLSGGRRAK